MTAIIETDTGRLKLRQWIDGDFEPFARINSDPEVMKYYPNILSEEESNNLVHKFKILISEKGWGFWAVERIEDNSFIGFVGLNEPLYDLPVSPCVEIGWRLGKEYWGNGYATEAGKACLDIAFNILNLSEVYSFTSLSNKKSKAVMERIGMKDTGVEFEHPMIIEGHELRRHCLYKQAREKQVE